MLGDRIYKSHVLYLHLVAARAHPVAYGVGKGNHADRLPHTQKNTGAHTAVQALDTVLLVDVCSRVHNRRLGRTVLGGGLRQRLHLGLAQGGKTYLDTDNLDRLVPGSKSATDRRAEDALHRRQLVFL